MQKKILEHIFWTATDHVARLGTTRLIGFPLVAWFLGPEEFGEFVLAFSIATILGNAVNQSFTNYIIRTISGFEKERHNALVAYCVKYSAVVTSGLLVTFLISLPLVSPKFRTDHFLFWYCIFAVHYSILAPTETSLATSRVNRNFRRLALMHAAGALSMVAGILMHPKLGNYGIAFGLLAWAFVPAILELRGHQIRSSSNLHKAERSGAIRGVCALYSSAVVQLAGGYLDRVVLAMWWPTDEVAFYFAAVSLGLLFHTPALIASTLLLSLLGRVRDPNQFSSRFLLLYLLATIVVACGVFLIGYPMGRYLLETLYPQLHTGAIGLWAYAIGSAAILSTTSLVRPFIVKFMPLRILPALSSISLAVRIGTLLLLVPIDGKLGAAQALLIATAIMAVLWLLLFAYFVFQRKTLVAKVGSA